MRGIKTITRQLRPWMTRVITALLALCLLAHPASAMPRLLLDMGTGEVLYAEEAGQPWHPASLTKLMTAYVTFEAIAAGRVSLDTPVIMSQRALAEPPSKVGLPVDTALTLEDALYLLIVKSANDIAVAIAETVSGSAENFASEMNQTAAALDMTATHFVNPHGLHDPEQVTSARDLGILALNIRARHPRFADLFATEAVRLGQSRLESNNNLLTHFAGTNGMKTGFVCASGLNIVATAQRGGRSLMAVVLGGSSSRERGELTAELMLRGFAGELGGTGRSVFALANTGAAPVNMRPMLCGAEAKAYVAQREAAYPFGLEGQPTFLDADIAGMVHPVSTLGRLRDVPLPRPRPLWAPDPVPATTTAEIGPIVPLPRPRPFLRGGL